MSDDVTTGVLVIGAGPCGITLANLLGTYGVATLVVDADAAPYPFPRAVGIDDESLRTFQSAGVVGQLLDDMVQNTPIRYYTSWGRLIAHVEPSVRPFGWPRRNNFLQPLFEATLRETAQQHQSVSLRTGWRLTGYQQDGDGVSAELTDAAGSALRVRARYLVGADGGRSTVRRIAGIEMTGSTAPQKWLVVDVADDYLDAPYSAVYCDPDRPVLMVPLPYRHRRFEFKITDTDDEDRLTDPDTVLRTLLAPRYGRTPLPTVLRSAIYLHHSRTADSFQDRRVFLAGDAAHLQPPFFGQGMNSGIRDATNLAWKLALVLAGHASETMLASYDAERRGHARTMVSFATRIGQMYSPKNALTERARDVVFRGVQRVPGARDYILQMKYKPLPRYTDGIVVPYAGPSADSAVGRMFGQPWVETMDGRKVMLDDELGHSFAVLGIHVDPAAALGAEAAAWWQEIGARFVHVLAPRSGPLPAPGEPRHAGPPAAGPAHAGGVTKLEDVDGAFRDWLLRRPGDCFLVLRPDRYVAAVCGRDGIDQVTGELRAILAATTPARLPEAEKQQRLARQGGLA
jgi:3-(3-hydroxy-phenyl)propionate hydroxylase